MWAIPVQKLLPSWSILHVTCLVHYDLLKIERENPLLRHKKTYHISREHARRGYLVIAQKLRRRESGLLDEWAPQILRCAQDDKTPGCHPERSEGSVAGLWVITR